MQHKDMEITDGKDGDGEGCHEPGKSKAVWRQGLAGKQKKRGKGRRAHTPVETEGQKRLPKAPGEWLCLKADTVRGTGHWGQHLHSHILHKNMGLQISIPFPRCLPVKQANAAKDEAQKGESVTGKQC